MISNNIQKSIEDEVSALKTFEQDTDTVIEQTNRFVRIMQPAHMLTKAELKTNVYDNSADLLDSITFYKIKSCSVSNEDEIEEFLEKKMTKFYTAIHSLKRAIVYGVISYDGNTNLVIGVYTGKKEEEAIKKIMQGLLDKVEIEEFRSNYGEQKCTTNNVGFVSGIPSVKLNEEKQRFDIGPIMKSLNGYNYSLLFVSRPINNNIVSEKYREMVKIKDTCFAVSKRNISRQQGASYSVSNTEGKTTTESYTTSSSKGGNAGGSAIVISGGDNWNKTESHGTSVSDNFSKTISEAMNSTTGASYDIQNGFALELMEYADKSIERIRQGRCNGMWESLITFSSDNIIANQILAACIKGELSKPNADLLPVTERTLEISIRDAQENPILIPKILKGEEKSSKLCTVITSEELGFISTPPSGGVPNFEIKVEQSYPLISNARNGIMIGNINDGTRILDNMPFSLSKEDLARHTFVCGITGSGKTTTVKRILSKAKTPFLVIESAKTEYRNMKLENEEKPTVYTFGRPEINCVSVNPFYIQQGVSPQAHIDLLKDLFNASFSFYGPMPYILEKCLHNIYKQKGWNLTLGYHPFLANTENLEDLFDSVYAEQKYRTNSHKFLFPTMHDLKQEVERYIEVEMNYEGDVAGNIKSAIKARLESLCSGSKGYMFNTHECIDMEELLNQNVIFELEGLADDSDKAFSVGLMVIFINEYRQTHGKNRKNKSTLSHLLVIEEAHRLLKNINTEKTSEDTGNPKGKAVEHFTNMIAEMRAYGQGVIIAEQIPSKLAPDVIKNSSNKIVQRLVAMDDQASIANTIGIDAKNAIQLGTLKMGQALCHKEGMSSPVNVSIIPTEEVIVTDAMLYNDNLGQRIKKINLSILNEAIGSDLSMTTILLINALLIQEEKYIKVAIDRYYSEIRKLYIKKGIALIKSGSERELQAELITQSVQQYLMRGTYCVKSLLTDEIQEKILSAIINPSKENVSMLRKLLQIAYEDDPMYRGQYFIAMLVEEQYSQGMNIRNTIKNYFVMPDEKSVEGVLDIIRGVAL